MIILKTKIHRGQFLYKRTADMPADITLPDGKWPYPYWVIHAGDGHFADTIEEAQQIDRVLVRAIKIYGNYDENRVLAQSTAHRQRLLNKSGRELMLRWTKRMWTVPAHRLLQDKHLKPGITLALCGDLYTFDSKSNFKRRLKDNPEDAERWAPHIAALDAAVARLLSSGVDLLVDRVTEWMERSLAEESQAAQTDNESGARMDFDQVVDLWDRVMDTIQNKVALKHPTCKIRGYSFFWVTDALATIRIFLQGQSATHGADPCVHMSLVELGISQENRNHLVQFICLGAVEGFWSVEGLITKRNLQNNQHTTGYAHAGTRDEMVGALAMLVACTSDRLRELWPWREEVLASYWHRKQALYSARNGEFSRRHDLSSLNKFNGAEGQLGPADVFVPDYMR